MNLWLVALLACKGPTDTGDLPEVPAFEDAQRVVTIGDNVGSNPSWSRSYIALLADNDDELFPAFAGSDLATVLPDAEVVRLDKGGDSFYTLAASAQPFCEECLPADDLRPTLVIIELGVNDLVATALAMLNDESLRADPTPALDEFQGDVRTVLRMTEDRTLFPTPPLVYVTNVYDPSDGVGDVADLVTSFFPFPGAEDVTPELGLAIIAGFNDAIEAEVMAIDAQPIDIHGAYLGHGYHYNDDTSPFYDAEDPSIWFGTVIDPNLRGAHELRRTTWLALTGESITAIPTDLPVESTTGLPVVPTDGWAKAIADSAVTAEIADADMTYVNIAADPEVALGEPSGSTFGVVAVGVLGAWITFDMGEQTRATDGDGEDLVVLEYGTLSGGTPEPYRVSVADSPDGPWTILGDAFGERAFDLAPAGVTSARYIRVESLAQMAEVLGGMGSPYYPGPELDAVGVVYPAP